MLVRRAISQSRWVSRALVDEVAKLIAEARIAFRLLLIYFYRSLSSIRNVRNGEYTLRLHGHYLEVTCTRLHAAQV